MEMKPIEQDFPIEYVNEIAEREAHAKEKYRPVLFIHKWWARRLGSDFGGKVVLDPMMGGGTTVVEALRTGCKVVAQDLNPVAWFLVKKIVEPVDIEELKNAFKKLEELVAEEIKKYYKTVCPHCLEEYASLEGKDRGSEECLRRILV